MIQKKEWNNKDDSDVAIGVTCGVSSSRRFMSICNPSRELEGP